MKYRVPVIYTFEGYFDIDAESKEAAVELANKDCGLTIGEVHSSLNDEDVYWDFPVHPETEIGEAKKIITLVKVDPKN